MTVRAAAESVGWDKSTLSRMETGARPPALEEVAQLLGVYRVVGELRDEVLRMARSIDEPGWWNHGDRGLARATTALASYEAESTRIADWASLIIPGLLQTADYARLWMLADGVPPASVDVRVRARMKRQRVPAHGQSYRVFIGESALRSPVGDCTTMARQMVAIRDAAYQPTTSVRIVPSDAGPHRGQIGAFHQMDFADTPPVVLVELLRSSLFMDEPWQTTPYVEAVTQLANVALGETESIRLITQMQARWSDRERAGELVQVQL